MKKIFLIITLLLSFTITTFAGSLKDDFIEELETIKTGDEKKINKYLTDKGYSEDNAAFIDSPYLLEQYKRMEYTILDVKEKGNNGSMRIKIKAPNLKKYFPEAYKQLIYSMILEASYEDKITAYNDTYTYMLKNDKDIEYNEKVLNLVFKKTDDNLWILISDNADNDEFQNILTGNLSSVTEEEVW